MLPRKELVELAERKFLCQIMRDAKIGESRSFPRLLLLDYLSESEKELIQLEQSENKKNKMKNNSNVHQDDNLKRSDISGGKRKNDSGVVEIGENEGNKAGGNDKESKEAVVRVRDKGRKRPRGEVKESNQAGDSDKAASSKKVNLTDNQTADGKEQDKVNATYVIL